MDQEKLKQAFDLFDSSNGEDPRCETVEGKKHPVELLYAKRLTEWVQQLNPNASEPLLLASRAQHLCRWKIPRTDFEPGKIGYLKWRRTLYQFHADEATKILQKIGYDSQTIDQVREIILKKNQKTNPDTQAIEDALCLVFLKFQFKEFVEKTPPEKMPGIIQKTWAKMSERARQEALKLSFPPEIVLLIQKSIQS